MFVIINKNTNGVMGTCTNSSFNAGSDFFLLHTELDDSSGFVYDGTTLRQNEPPVITIITVAAMRARLTVSEREAIRNSTDIFVRDIWDDLLSRNYIDLNDTLTVQGIAYITNYLTNIPDVFDNNVMTVTDLATRSTELLVNGTQSEKYNGIL